MLEYRFTAFDDEEESSEEGDSMEMGDEEEGDGTMEEGDEEEGM